MGENSSLRLNLISLLNNLERNKWYLLLYVIMILSFSLFQLFAYNHHASVKREVITLFLLILIGIILLLYRNSNKEKIHRIAFVTIIVFGIITLVLSPILVGCDEDEHLARTDLTSEGVFIPHYEQIGSHRGYIVNDYVVALDEKTRFKTIFSSATDDKPINKSSHLVEAAFAQNVFYAYLPQGFGAFLAKELNLTNIWVLWLGGVMNLLMYACVASYAIKKTPILKVPMLMIACLPFTIYEATTVSSDAFINCFSLLLMAYFFSMYKTEKASVSKENLIIFYILVLLVGLIKPPLLLFACLTLIIPRENYESPSYFKYALIGIILIFIIGVLWNVTYSMPNMRRSHRGPRAQELNIDTVLQLKFMFSSVKYFTAVMGDILSKTWYVFKDLFRFCDWQGKYGVYQSSILALIFLVYYGIISFLYPIKYKISRNKRLFAALVFLVIYIALFLIQYLTWTPVGSLRIQGVQGRYFIPLLILLPFILNINSENTRYGERIRKHITKERLDNINLLTYIVIIGLLSCLQILTVVLYY
ncbi:DUF2142 domain-containing protein [uncultured Methanobrevibacter sp.]|uniref:DUF2142 domain-containing protein n=1 Tax=uncultured Methanobrevibacter sp. TaxID=253161 RepID=UPI00258EDF1A|nr:DUF2142 domain-containing protein [uncultured Methanobrevibacter sp.]